MHSRYLIHALAIAATTVLLAGCGSESSTSSPRASTKPAPDSVTISNFKFAPATLTVQQGAGVSVTNDDGTAHTLTADDGNSFDTGALDQGASKTITVSKPGTYAYHCSIHAFMKGTLVVK